ncbi:DNA-processing protein DprA [Labilibacter marinus]|uniref:DNA-processing protein DprA n=1 Tax=Labilibacter marinus TaxID=1477105 RepID=UPI000B08685E|nr:DNA-processing protein DprA [Labilibacter marinus]
MILNLILLRDHQLKYKIALSLIKGLGPKLIRNVIAYLGDVEAVFSEKEQVLRKVPGIGMKQAKVIAQSNPLERAEKEIEFIEKHKIDCSFFLDDTFPSRLNNCEDGPVMLYKKGNNTLASKKILSIVGTRQVTEEGRQNCRNLIKELAQNHPDVVVVSGLAYGVDICAHRAALEFGLPTVAVLAHGLDRIYPNMHRNVAKDLLNNGALLTEFMSETNPDKPNFVKRNRIVAGLSDATLVVESAQKGGALITAHLAQSYNRDVLAFPGRVDDEYSKGCNKLIKSNVAALVECAADVEYALNWASEEKDKGKQQSLFFNEPEGEQGVIYQLIRQEKEASVNFLSIKLEMSIAKVSSLLFQLEMDGFVKSLPGSLYRCL